MRAADKIGDARLVRGTARAQRKDVDAGTEKSAEALFAAAYVFTKYYSPGRALPLLEQARRKAEKEQNWELAHASRDGLGVCLKQLGRYSESIEHFSHNLAFARRTLNPQAEATSLVNVAVAEMAMGSYDRAATHLEESAQIDAQYPRWPGRPYRYDNQAELALEIDRIDEAVTGFEAALELAEAMELWRISVGACAGLAICAVRRGDFESLARHCSMLEMVVGSRVGLLADRWKVEGALAWNVAVNCHEPDCARARLHRALRELARRDVDHWLWLSLEAIELDEYVTGRIAAEDRNRLIGQGELYLAAGIVRRARKRLADRSAARG
jgi:tetratricopeptide (TPR) repeat protein